MGLLRSCLVGAFPCAHNLVRDAIIPTVRSSGSLPRTNDLENSTVSHADRQGTKRFFGCLAHAVCGLLTASFPADASPTYACMKGEGGGRCRFVYMYVRVAFVFMCALSAVPFISLRFGLRLFSSFSGFWFLISLRIFFPPLFFFSGPGSVTTTSLPPPSPRTMFFDGCAFFAV